MALLLALVVVSNAVVSGGSAPPTPATAITLAERVVQHNPSWKPTNVYCMPPRSTAYDTPRVPNGSRRRYTCEWVAQGDLLLPDEIVTVSTVSSGQGEYRFSLVSTTYLPGDRPASCTIERQATGRYRATCTPTA